MAYAQTIFLVLALIGSMISIETIIENALDYERMKQNMGASLFGYSITAVCWGIFYLLKKAE